MNPSVSKPPTWLLQAIKAVQKEGLATKDRIINHVCRHHGVPRDTVQQQVDSATNKGQILRVRQARGACIYINPTDATWSRAKVQLKRLKSKELSSVSLRPRAARPIKEEDISEEIEIWETAGNVGNCHLPVSSSSPEARMVSSPTSNRTETVRTQGKNVTKSKSDPSDDFVTSLLLDALDKVKYKKRKKSSREAIVSCATKASGLQREVVEKGFDTALAKGILGCKTMVSSGGTYYYNPSDTKTDSHSQTIPVRQSQSDILFTTTPATHSDYFNLICKAIIDLDEEGGSSLLAISRYLVHDLQVQNDYSFKARLQQAAKRGMAQGKLQKDGILYKLDAAEKSDIQKCQLVGCTSDNPDMIIKQLFRDVLRKMKANKQKPSEELICRRISRDCSISEKDLLECLDVCVEEGSILQIYKVDGTVIYKLPGTDAIKPLKTTHREKKPQSSGTGNQLRLDADNSSMSLDELLHKVIKKKNKLNQQTTAAGIFGTLLRMTKKFTLDQVRSQLALCVEEGNMTKIGHGGKTLYYSVTGSQQGTVRKQSSTEETSKEISVEEEVLQLKGTSDATVSSPLPKGKALPVQESKKYRKWLTRAIHDVKRMRQRVTAERICRNISRKHNVDPSVVQCQLQLVVQDSRSTIKRVIMPDGVATYTVHTGKSDSTTTKKQTARKSIKQTASTISKASQKSGRKTDPIISNCIVQSITRLKRLKIAHTAECICRQVYLDYDVDSAVIPELLQLCVKDGVIKHFKRKDGGSYYECSAIDSTSTNALVRMHATPPPLAASQKTGTRNRIPKRKKNKLSTVSKSSKQKGGRKPVLMLAGTKKPDPLVKKWILDAIQKCRDLRIWTSEGQIIKRVQMLHESADTTVIKDNLAKCLQEGSVEKKFLRDGRESYRMNKDVKNDSTLSKSPSPDPLVKAALLEAIHTNENTAATPFTDEICKKVANMLGQRVQHVYEQLRLCMEEGSIAECEQSSPDPLVKATILDVIRSQDPRNRPYTEDICEEVAQLLGKDVDEIEMELQLCIKEGSIAEMEEEEYEEPPRPIVHVDPDSSLSELVVHAAQQLQDRQFTVRDVEKWIQDNFSMDVAAGVDLRDKVQQAYTQGFMEGALPPSALNSSAVQGTMDVDGPRQAAYVHPRAEEPYPVMLVCHQDLQQHETSTDDLQTATDSSDDVQEIMDSTDDLQQSMDSTDDLQQNMDSTDDVKQSMDSTDDLQQSMDSTDELQQSMDSTDDLQQSMDSTDDLQQSMDSTDDLQQSMDSTGDHQTTFDNADNHRSNAVSTDDANKRISSTKPLCSISDAKPSMNNISNLKPSLLSTNDLQHTLAGTDDLQVKMEAIIDLQTSVINGDSQASSAEADNLDEREYSTVDPKQPIHSTAKSAPTADSTENVKPDIVSNTETPQPSRGSTGDKQPHIGVTATPQPKTNNEGDLQPKENSSNDSQLDTNKTKDLETDNEETGGCRTVSNSTGNDLSNTDSDGDLQPTVYRTDDTTSHDLQCSPVVLQPTMVSEHELVSDMDAVEDVQHNKSMETDLHPSTDVSKTATCSKDDSQSTSSSSRHDGQRSINSTIAALWKGKKIVQTPEDGREDPTAGIDSGDGLQSDTHNTEDMQSDGSTISGPPLLSPQRGGLAAFPASPKPNPPLLSPQRIIHPEHGPPTGTAERSDVSVCRLDNKDER